MRPKCNDNLKLLTTWASLRRLETTRLRQKLFPFIVTFPWWNSIFHMRKSQTNVWFMFSRLRFCLVQTCRHRQRAIIKVNKRAHRSEHKAIISSPHCMLGRPVERHRFHALINWLFVNLKRRNSCFLSFLNAQFTPSWTVPKFHTSEVFYSDKKVVVTHLNCHLLLVPYFAVRYSR